MMPTSIGPSTEPLLPCLHLDFVPLIKPSAPQFSQLLIHLTSHLSNLYFISRSTDVKGKQHRLFSQHPQSSLWIAVRLVKEDFPAVHLC